MASSTLGSALRATRERAGWTREALAYHSGLSTAAIAQIESGRRTDVRLASIVALATALDVSVDHLIGHAAGVGRGRLEHRVLVYGSDGEYVASTAPFLLEGLERRECVLAVTAPRQASWIRDELGRDGSDVVFRDSAEWYGSPRAALADYRSFVAERVERGCGWVRIIGEPVWAGRSPAELDAWTRYESMINLSLSSAPATIMCPYDNQAVPTEILAAALHTHPEVVDGDHVSRSTSYREPEEFLLSAP